MKIVTSIPELASERAILPAPVGLVPTMGFLHDGHLSLVRRAVEECGSVITTIYVNPSQFSPEEDYDSYPNNFKYDVAILKSEGVDLLWLPGNNEMYGDDFQSWVVVEDLTQKLEGIYRPHHFKGVTTIVSKLFNAVRPDKAYFGQKDAQQALVIQKMVIDLNYPIDIRICPIHREPDGLAMSSRNVFLSKQQRGAAKIIYESLVQARSVFERGERNAQIIRQLIIEKLDAEPLTRVQYVSISNPVSLEEIHGQIESALVSMAVYFGKTRLIDNIILR